MNLDAFGKVTGAIQNITVALGILVGGAWALFQFGAKKESDTAATALAKAETELRVLEKQLKGDASLDIEVTASQACSDDPTRYFIDTRVAFTNRGTRSAVVDLVSSRDVGLFAVRALIQPNGRTVFIDSYQPQIFAFDPNSRSAPVDRNVVDVQPNTTSKIRYWIPVPSPGLYIVFFSAPMSKSDVDMAKERLKRENFRFEPNAWKWTGRDYIVVRDDLCGSKKDK